jgi:nucleotide-binding universal stress UspA family protein
MYEAVVVGTDGSATATEAVRRAVAIAVATSAHLHIVYAYSPPSRTVAMGPEAGFVIAQGHAGWDDEVHSDVQAKLDTLAAQAAAEGVKVTVHAIPRHPVDALLEVATAQHAGLLVVGNRGMTGARRVLGSVPNSIAHKAPCDVLIVHTT